MQVRVLLFGPEAKALGRDHILAEVAPPVNCASLRSAIQQAYPGLAAHLPHARFAVNGAFAGQDQPLAPEDEIALIGLVGGG